MKQIFLTLFIVLSVGCSSIDLSKVRDQRGQQGCYIFEGDISSKYTLEGEVFKTAVWCSEQLPENYLEILKTLQNIDNGYR